MFTPRTTKTRRGGMAVNLALRALRGATAAAAIVACGLLAAPSASAEPGPVISASAGDQSVTLSWSPLTEKAVFEYEFRMRTEDESSWGSWTLTGAGIVGDGLGNTVTGLTNGTAYAFQVRAEYYAGWGQNAYTAASNTVTATPNCAGCSE